MRHFAVVGSGPAGFYTAEALAKAYGDAGPDRHHRPLSRALRPDPLRRRARPPVAEGRLASATTRSPKTDGVGFVGNVAVGRDVSVDELLESLRRGDPRHRRAARPQARHPRRGSARRGRLGRVRRLVQWPSRFRRPRPAARRDATRRSSAMAMSRSIARGSCRRPATNSKGRTSSAMRSTRSTQSAIRTITILGRRGPHQIAMTPKELGELGHLEAATPIVDLADFPPVEADEALEPGHRKSITILREFADLRPDDQAQADRVRLLRQAGADRRRRPGRAADRRADRARRDRRGAAAPARPMRSRRA